MNKKLLIVYRSCGKEQKPEEFNQSRPIWFNKRRCWNSFYNNFGDNKNIDIYVVFDGEKEDELSEYISKFKVKQIIYLNNVGNKDSLLYCYDLMSKMEGYEYLYLIEDDYLWLPDSYKIAMEGLESFGHVGTISLYHAPDRIFRNDDITLGHEYILATKSCYWRTAESNTATFAISKEFFLKYKQEFIDCHVQDRLLFVNLLRKYNLRHFNPISEKYGCTHVNRFFPSLFIDWESYNNSIKL